MIAIENLTKVRICLRLVKGCWWWWWWWQERQTDRERDRQRQRQTERQTHRQRERERFSKYRPSKTEAATLSFMDCSHLRSLSKPIVRQINLNDNRFAQADCSALQSVCSMIIGESNLFWKAYTLNFFISSPDKGWALYFKGSLLAKLKKSISVMLLTWNL